ncbi:hypothetical protein K458DRAFT_393900 [Lentithecium fluviatile CBS 122367]|uniref:Zinc-binding loop region of homing endonuclease domain-containing protein n=1 Tax=Lentithecium fluviatile CBS 122367 TaxID=1168545 RepID=A0A6G1INN6_9PLEO|nr:hypothetical protein K458DRAFT_393900 [Lentithecium fluviatile CBS 122367]
MGQSKFQASIYREHERQDSPSNEPGDRAKKRHRSDSVDIDEDDDFRKIIVLDDDEGTTVRGEGTAEDPFMFPEWMTGNIIPRADNGALFEISDDDDLEDDTPILPTSRLPTPSRSPTLRQDARLFFEGLQRLAEESEAEKTDIAKGRSFSHRSFGTHSRTLSVLSATTSSHTAEDSGNLYELASRLGGREEEANDRLLDAPSAGSRSFTSSVLPCFSPSNSSTNLQATPDPLSGPLHERWLSESEDGEDEDMDDEEDEEMDDDASCVLIFEDVKPSHLAGEPWTVRVKEEDSNEEPSDLPALTHSQERDDLVTSQDVLDPLQSKYELGAATQASCQIHRDGLESPFDADQDTSRLEEQQEWNVKIPVEIRKRLFYEVYWKDKIPALERILQKYYSTLRLDRDSDECWLYCGHRLPKPPGRALGIGATFRHNGKSERLTINIAFVSMLLKNMLSADQIEGIVTESWHASHLCGNWTCLNERHVVPESGRVNARRNACFADKEGPCSHTPACQKHLKVDLEILRPKVIAQEDALQAGTDSLWVESCRLSRAS